MSLTSSQIARLKAFVDADDRIGYYETLTSWGDKYAPLALGVVLNSTLSGAVANAHAMQTHGGLTLADNTALAQLGLGLMRADFAERQAPSEGLNLSFETIERYHSAVFVEHSISPEAWTAYIPYLATAPADRSALWENLLQDNFIRNLDFIRTTYFYNDYPGADIWSTNMLYIGLQAVGPKGMSGYYGNYDIAREGTGRLIGGTSERDIIEGTSSDDVIIGFGGRIGPDDLYGNAGNDRIYGGKSKDFLVGGSGKDLLSGGSGDDVLVGGDLGRGFEPAAAWNDGVSDRLEGGFGFDTYLVFGVEPSTPDYGIPKGQAWYEQRLKDIDIVHDSDGRGVVFAAYQYGGTITPKLDFSGSYSYMGLRDGLSLWFGTYGEAVSATIADEYGTTHTYLFLSAPHPYYGIHVAIEDFRNGDLGITLANYGLSPAAGTPGNDTLTGTDAPDRLDLGNGDDAASGGRGDDVLNGQAGNDTLSGQDGADQLAGGAGNDTLTGGDGNDTFLVETGSGIDHITDFAAGSDVIEIRGVATASSFATLMANATEVNGSTRVDLGSGNLLWLDGVAKASLTASSFVFWTAAQTLDGTAGSDTLTGSAGDDTLDGKADDDALYGLGGDDRLIGGAGNDDLRGGDGSDTFVFRNGDGSDYVHDFTRGEDLIELFDVDFATSFQEIRDRAFEAGDGSAVLSFGTGDYVRLVGVSLASLTEADFALGGVSRTVTGTTGGDALYGGAGDDRLRGGAGNDDLRGRAGSDTFVFGTGDGSDYIHDFKPGRDTIELTDVTFASSFEDIMDHAFAVSDGTVLSFGGNDAIRLIGIDKTGLSASDFRLIGTPKTLNGTAGADTLAGGAGNDVLDGKGGDDTISGGNGDDRIIGGAGDDTLRGGAGRDTFVFGPAGGADTILDFKPGQDILQISGVAMATSFAQVLANAFEVDGRTGIDFGGVDGIWLEGVTKAQLGAADFVFV